MRKFHLNVRSLRQDTNLEYVQDKADDFKPHIILLSETLRKKEHTDTDTLDTPLLSFDRNCHTFVDSSKCFQGLSIYSRLATDQIKFHQPNSNLEMIVADINFYGNKSCIVYGYLSPSISDKSKIDSFFEEMVKIFNNRGKNVNKQAIVDFNAKDPRLYPTTSKNYAGSVVAAAESSIRLSVPAHMASEV